MVQTILARRPPGNVWFSSFCELMVEALSEHYSGEDAGQRSRSGTVPFDGRERDRRSEVPEAIDDSMTHAEARLLRS
jgi:hypothetical protein